MRIKEGFKLRPLGKEHVVTCENVSLVNFNKVISLNSSATYLWESVQGKEFTADTLKDLLLEKYEVDPETAARDAAALAQQLLDAGVAE
ncbi:MAG: PqqD family protein [Bacteroidales bacterium]|nr:PqqD family protein [Candidatus Cryptobacteroides onthequi]